MFCGGKFSGDGKLKQIAMAFTCVRKKERDEKRKLWRNEFKKGEMKEAPLNSK